MPFNVGDRVYIDLEGLESRDDLDLQGKLEATGTVVEIQMGVVYDVELDEPIGSFRILTHLVESRLRKL